MKVDIGAESARQSVTEQAPSAHLDLHFNCPLPNQHALSGVSRRLQGPAPLSRARCHSFVSFTSHGSAGFLTCTTFFSELQYLLLPV